LLSDKEKQRGMGERHGGGVSDDEAAASKLSEELQKLFEEGEGRCVGYFGSYTRFMQSDPL
jgi:hypothetical protein